MNATLEPNPAATDEREPLTLPDVVRIVFSGRARFAQFAGSYLTRENPPAFMLVAWLLGMDGMAGALELEYMTTGTHLVDNWFHAWLRIIFAGIGAAVVRYWVAGTLFHAVVKLSRGHSSARTSRCIFLYAALPVVVVELGVKVAQMLVYGNKYFTGVTNPAFDGAAGACMAVAFGYSAVLCYTGMRRVQGADRVRSLVVLVLVGILAMWFASLLLFQGGA